MQVPSRKESDRLNRRTLKRLAGYIFRYKGRIAAGVLCSLIASFSNMFSITAFVPIFNTLGQEEPAEVFEISGNERNLIKRNEEGEVLALYEGAQLTLASVKIRINSLFEGKEQSEIILLIAVFILPLYLIKLLSVTGTVYFIGTAGYMAIRDIRMEMYEKIHTLSLSYFSRERTGPVMSRVINDTETVGRSVSMELTDSIIDIIYLITHLILLAMISFKMLLITFVIIPLVSAPLDKITRKVRRFSLQQQQKLADMGAHVQEIISGIRVIRAFSMENFENERFRKINNDLYSSTFRTHYYHQVGPSATEFIATVVVLGFLSWGAYQISEGYLSKGLFFAFFFTLIFIMRPVKHISVMMNLMASAVAAAGRIFELMDTPPDITEKPDAVPFRELKKGIEFRNVSYIYPEAEKKALNNVNIKIEAGQMVALVGTSGSGKSTLADLIARFADPSEGSILLDGINIKDYKIKELRRSIGFVTQNIFLFNASIRENIAYGAENVTEEQIISAAKLAHAHEFISELPVGYSTLTGERGVMLSGGQRQRIAIARALIQNPSVLVFDEATSALDNENEMLIQEAMENLRSGRTMIVVAHRLSTVYKADRIFVLKNGIIAESGTHQELIRSGGIYSELVK